MAEKKSAARTEVAEADLEQLRRENELLRLQVENAELRKRLQDAGGN